MALPDVRRADLWAIVLAGGEGARLSSLAERICGSARPKQFLPLLGARSLLDQTIDRVARRVPAARTVVVGKSAHAPFLSPLAERQDLHLMLQPHDRGTAAGVLYPVHWVAHQAPDAVVAIFPSDHLVLEEEAFMACVEETAEWVRHDPRWIALLGATPTDPEPEYGWIEPGEAVDEGGAFRHVRRFWEKPSPAQARRCLAAGCVWNTFVFVATAERLVAVGRDLLPTLHDRLRRIWSWAGTEHEAWAVEQAYRLAPCASFSDSVLAAAPEMLVVRRLPPLTWCDLGTPDRVLRALRLMRLQPAWLSAALERPARLPAPADPTAADPVTASPRRGRLLGHPVS
jgi:mannose-1-phosphate guanylyltransferase